LKIAINLASQPFRRDRAMIMASGAVAMVLVLTLGVLIWLARMDNVQLAGLRQEIAGLNQKLRAASAEDQRLEGVMRQPQNATVLGRSVFINDLIAHKSISWSRLFTDLEKTVPYNVKVMQLHPTVNSRNQVMLDMQVGSEKPEALDDLLKAFERSPIFGPVYFRSSQAPTQAEPLYRSRITVPYDQKL
jgi:type IV pilus assembly protein PilN